MKRITIISICFLILGSAADAQVATVPYSEDFNSGSVGPEWTLFNSAPEGRIRFTAITPLSPASAGNAMVMDKSPSGGADVTNQATLAVDLASSGGGILSFYFRETSDEPDPDDGVFISDGGPLFEIVNLQGGPSAWTLYTVNLNQAISTHGLNINNTIQIVFSHADNYETPTDGFFFDDIDLLPPPAALTVNLTSAAGSLNWTVTTTNPPVPGGEVYNFVSLQDMQPDGSGPFFGIGFDAVVQIATPLSPTNPFHTNLDASGIYSLILPPGVLPPGLHFESTSILIEFGAITRISNTASVDT